MLFLHVLGLHSVVDPLLSIHAPRNDMPQFELELFSVTDFACEGSYKCFARVPLINPSLPETTMHCCSLELEQFFHQIFACEALKYDSVLGFCFFLLFVLCRQVPLLHHLLVVHLRETNLGLGSRVMLSI
jgi:hypothetical protein